MINDEMIQELSVHMKPGFSIFYDENLSTIEGTLVVDALFDFKRYKYVLFPEKKTGSTYIYNEISIRIEIDDKNLFRKVWEKGNVIPKEIEYHINPIDKSICLFLPEEILLLRTNKEGILDSKKYLSNFVIPYFFDAFYYMKYGKRPRGEYAHGELAYLQFLDENRSKNDEENKLLFNLALEKLLESPDWIYYYEYLYKDNVKPYLVKKITESVNCDIIRKALEGLKRALTQKDQALVVSKFMV